MVESLRAVERTVAAERLEAGGRLKELEAAMRRARRERAPFLPAHSSRLIGLGYRMRMDPLHWERVARSACACFPCAGSALCLCREEVEQRSRRLQALHAEELTDVRAEQSRTE